jgi:hypothetical protein
MMNQSTATTQAEAAAPHGGIAALGCPVQQRPSRFRRVLHLLLDTVREIFDESAYERFLLRHQLNSSRASYALFLEDQETRKARQPKCC